MVRTTMYRLPSRDAWGLHKNKLPFFRAAIFVEIKSRLARLQISHSLQSLQIRVPLTVSTSTCAKIPILHWYTLSFS